MQIYRRFVPQFILNSYEILPKKDRPKLLVLVILQAGIGFIDLLGVAAMGVLGALAVTGIQSQKPGNRVSQVLDLIGISELSFSRSGCIPRTTCRSNSGHENYSLSLYNKKSLIFFKS